MLSLWTHVDLFFPSDVVQAEMGNIFSLFLKLAGILLAGELFVE